MAATTTSPSGSSAIKPIDRIFFRAKFAACAAVLVALFATSRGLADEASNHSATSAPRFKPLVSKEITYLTEPLTADGRVDYVAALNTRYGQNIRPHDNAAIALWPLVRNQASPEQTTRFYQAYDLPVPPDSRIAWQEFIPRKHDDLEIEELMELDRQLRASGERPWSREQFPLIAAWLQTNEAALDVAAQAARKPNWYLPFVEPSPPEDEQFDVVGRPSIFSIGRNVGSALVRRSLFRMHQRQFDLAWDDLFSVLRLARHYQRGASLSERLVGHSLENMAFSAAEHFLQHAPLTHEAAMSRLGQLRDLPGPTPFVELVDWEQRCGILNLIASAAASGLPRHMEFLRGKPAILDDVAKNADWNVVLRICNRHYDRFVEILRLHNVKQQRLRIRQFNQEVKAINDRFPDALSLLSSDREQVLAQFSHELRQDLDHSPNKDLAQTQLVADWILGWYLTLLEPLCDSEIRVRQSSDLLLLGLRLAAYRDQHGGYPKHLRELQTADGQPLPADRFTGEPLAYRPIENGYILYSLGENEADDGGTPRSALRKFPRLADDIVLRVEHPE